MSVFCTFPCSLVSSELCKLYLPLVLQSRVFTPCESKVGAVQGGRDSHE